MKLRLEQITVINEVVKTVTGIGVIVSQHPAQGITRVKYDRFQETHSVDNQTPCVIWHRRLNCEWK